MRTTNAGGCIDVAPAFRYRRRMKTTGMITERINAASEALKQMGRDEIAKSLAAGVPVSYSESPGTITTEYPDGRKEVRKPG